MSITSTSQHEATESGKAMTRPVPDTEIRVEGRVYLVVEVDGDDWVIVRMDADGDDASMSTGEQNVDWEYVHVAVSDIERCA